MTWDSVSDEALEKLVQSGLDELKRRGFSIKGMKQKALVKARREAAVAELPARLAIIEALICRPFFYEQFHQGEGFTLSIWEKKDFHEVRLYLRGGIEKVGKDDDNWTIIYFYTGNPWQGVNEIRCEGDFPKHFAKQFDPYKLADFFRLICDRWLGYMRISTEDYQNRTVEPDAKALAQYELALAWLNYAPGYLKEKKSSS